MVTESLMVSDYAIIEEPRSRIDPSKQLYNEVGIRCPLCGRPNPVIEHGDTAACDGCGLSMTVWGNMLECVLKGDNDEEV